MKFKINVLLIITGCVLLSLCLLFISRAKATTYAIPKASEQPKGRTYLYSKPVTLTDKNGHKVVAKEYTATNGKKYIGN